MKKRNRSIARPRKIHLAIPMAPAVGLALAGAFGLAKATWETVIVSPRAWSMPAAVAMAFCSVLTSAGGTFLSTTTATFWRLTWPGATFVRSTVLPIACLLLVVSWL